MSAGPQPTAGDAPGLNQSQARAVVATFRYVDGLLADIERLARADLSMFAVERGDVAPDEQRLILAFASDARRRMLVALDRLGIARPQATVSARWGIETTLHFAASALGELDAARLRGYGALDAEVATDLQALTADLQAAALRAVALLHEHDEGGLKDRVSALPGPAGEVLRALERVSAEHGLAEVRSLIAAAAERAASATFDVGVFGRVSAGKSSLINVLVGAAVLPVGATPATAVPLRVQRGPLGATVHMQDGGRIEVGVEALREYATEERNPGNRQGVRAIEIKAPGVPAALRLLDTPGVGSLASSGPAQAFAWLPRCDLGLVLVAAGGPVSPDDIALVSGLAHAGVTHRVLLSKSDLLAAGERADAVAYVARELQAALGPEKNLAVQAVSTLPGHADELDGLRRGVLEPLAADHARASRAALRDRLHSLVSATAAALAGRSGAPDAHLVERHTAHSAAVARIRHVTGQLAGGAPSLLDQAADAVAGAWARGADGASDARTVLVAAAGASLEAVRAAVQAVRTDDQERGVARVMPPLFDPELLGAMPDLTPPRLARWLPRRAIAASRLRLLALPLQQALERYAARVEAWARARLTEREEELRLGPPVTGRAEADTGLARLHALSDRV